MTWSLEHVWHDPWPQARLVTDMAQGLSHCLSVQEGITVFLFFDLWWLKLFAPLSDLLLWILKNFITSIIVYFRNMGCYACIYVCTPHVSLVPMEPRTGSSARTVCALNCWASGLTQGPPHPAHHSVVLTVKSTERPCRGPSFGSQHCCQVGPNCPQLQFQGICLMPSDFHGHLHTRGTYKLMQACKHMHDK